MYLIYNDAGIIGIGLTLPIGATLMLATNDYAEAMLFWAQNQPAPPPPPPTPAYQLYVASLTQVGVGDPDATIKENTLNGAAWVRSGAGAYSKLLVVGIEAPLQVYIHGLGGWLGVGNPFIPISNAVSIIGYYTMYSAIDGLGNTSVVLNTFDILFVPTDLSALMAEFYLPEIRFYP